MPRKPEMKKYNCFHEEQMDVVDLSNMFDLYGNVQSSLLRKWEIENKDFLEMVQRVNDHRLLANDTNHALAGFVTGYAQVLLWEELYKYGKNVITCDTDSICSLRPPGSYNTPRGPHLGQWEQDCPDARCAIVPACKTYAIEFIDLDSQGKNCTKSKQRASPRTIRTTKY
jgi:hypothetical protein